MGRQGELASRERTDDAVKNGLGGESDGGGESFISIVKNGHFFCKRDRERKNEGKIMILGF
jgi:hypothetical protein